MSVNDLRTGVTDAPIRNNVIVSQDGTDESPAFVARMTRIWMGWVRAFTLWANIQGQGRVHPYDAADFGKTGGGTLTVDSGDLFTYTWRLVGDTLFVNIYLHAISIAGFVGTVTVALPTEVFDGPYIIAESQRFYARIVDPASTPNPLLGGTAEVVSTDNKIIIYDAAAPFAASTNATDINVSIFFKVARQ
jgi:hypothetical protein